MAAVKTATDLTPETGISRMQGVSLYRFFSVAVDGPATARRRRSDRMRSSLCGGR
ncbi:MAG TPA: hypothetical protein VLB79_04260 [Solirubrobacterales bacterium]|nr:hypothetical protein [Solirubrobacterales bacterium]